MRHGPLGERVMAVGQRVAARVHRDRYGQRADIRRPGHDGDRRDRHQIVRRVVRDDGGRVAGLERGQTACLDVRVHETAERPGARVRKHVVVRGHVVVLVPPAHRHGALEPVVLVLERGGQHFILFRVRRPHGRHVEVLETVVYEKPVDRS